MEIKTVSIKKDHIRMVDQLILVLDNYNKCMKSEIDQWDNNKCRELKIVTSEIDNLIELLFSFVLE